MPPTMRRFVPKASTLVWLALSLVLFGAAFVLTLSVTAVHGRAPTQPSKVHFSDDYLHVAALTSDWTTGDPVPELTFEGIDGKKEWGLDVFVPSADVKLLIDHVVPGIPCSSPRSADEIMTEDAEHKGIHTTSAVFSTDERTGNTTYLVSIDPGEGPLRIHCQVRAEAEHVTYRRREMAISSLMSPLIFSDAQKEMIGAYGPKSPVRVSIGLEGAEDFTFSHYYESGRYLQSSNAAYVPQDTVVTVSWSNLYSEQMRDVILIVIGSLIALGVTVLIEAARPYIDQLGERERDAGPSKG